MADALGWDARQVLVEHPTVLRELWQTHGAEVFASWTGPGRPWAERALLRGTLADAAADDDDADDGDDEGAPPRGERA